jgi:uncharacterized membrane protein (UPF0127 family)
MCELNIKIINKNTGVNAGVLKVFKYIKFFSLFIFVAFSPACSFFSKYNNSEIKSGITKQGKLIFFSSQNDILRKIDIECAQTQETRERGLMFRDFLGSDEGMLFIFPQKELCAFYMKNTKIPLDIIFISQENKSSKEQYNKIVCIHTNAIPYDETPLPSNYSIKYALEVNAGFCARHNITVGGYVCWQINKKL